MESNTTNNLGTYRKRTSVENLIKVEHEENMYKIFNIVIF